MALRTRAELVADIASKLPVQTLGQITAQKISDMITNLVDSVLLRDGVAKGPAAFRVRGVSTSNVDISQCNAGDVLDGQTLATGDFWLFAGQTTGSQNGLYIIGATAGTTARHPEWAAFNDLPGTVFIAMQGTVGAKTSWLCTSARGGTINSTAVTFERFHQTYSAKLAAFAANAGISGTITVSTSDPSGGADGDIWLKYIP